ncbi:MAG TPA: hypothetical protein VMW24_06590 [Sedimentisphaerales bacterium]|nr:hypothetical protein [Sedimentisphaerales bacterium]
MPSKPDFNIFVPLETFEKDGDLRIRGVITTEHRDREGEVVLQDGLDFTEFQKCGYFNDNHSKGTAQGAVLGYPLEISKGKTADGKKCHIVDGVLFKHYKPARDIFELASAMQQDPRKARKLGFSLQGKIQSRVGQPTIAKSMPDGSTQFVGDHVSKAIVRHVAITHSPVNEYTGLEALTKALTAGGAVEAPPASPGQGFPLRTESLDGGKKRTRRSAVDWLMKTKGLSRKAAEMVWDLAQIKQEKLK